MESGGIQVLMSPVPGQRVTEGKDPEDGSILAFRNGGEECLFASWEADEKDEERGRGMAWIPVGEFSPDPEAIRPPEIVDGAPEQQQQPEDETGTTERPVGHGPMGGRTTRLPRRPSVEG